MNEYMANVNKSGVETYDPRGGRKCMILLRKQMRLILVKMDESMCENDMDMGRK
jgi:hypothetical protein